MIAELGLDMSVDILATELEDLLKSRSTDVQKSQENERVREEGKVNDQESPTQSILPALPLSPAVSASAEAGRSEHTTTIQDTDPPLARIDDKPPMLPLPSPANVEQIPSSPSATGVDHRPLVETAACVSDSLVVHDLPSNSNVAPMPMPIDILILPTIEKQLSPGKLLPALSNFDYSQDLVKLGTAVVTPTEDEVTPATIVSTSESESASTSLMEASKDKDTILPSKEHEDLSVRSPPVGVMNSLLLVDEPQPIVTVSESPSDSLPAPPQQQQQLNPIEESKSSAKESSDSDDASSNEID